MDNFDMSSVLKMMDIINAMKPSTEPPPSEEKPQKKQYDDCINTPLLMSLKTSIPYLDYEHRRKLAVLTKLLEIKLLLEMYGDTVSEMSSGDYKINILQAIMPHLPEDKQRKIGLILKILEIKSFI